MLGVYDRDGVLVLGAAWLGVNVRGVNVLGVFVPGVVVELCGQVERENLVSGDGTVDVVRGVGVIVALGVVKVRGVKLRGVRLLGVGYRDWPAGDSPGEKCCTGATCGWNVLYCLVGPASAPAEPEPPGMALSRLSKSFRIVSRWAVTAVSMFGVGERRNALPASSPWFTRDPAEAEPAGEAVPNAVLLPPGERRSAAPPAPTLGRLSTSMYASRLCWSRPWAVAPVMALGDVLKVLPARPTTGAAIADAPPVVRAWPLGLGETVARVAPAPEAVVSALRPSSTGPRCPSRERSVDRS